jgi:hypothetical protein
MLCVVKGVIYLRNAFVNPTRIEIVLHKMELDWINEQSVDVLEHYVVSRKRTLKRLVRTGRERRKKVIALAKRKRGSGKKNKGNLGV